MIIATIVSVIAIILIIVLLVGFFSKKSTNLGGMNPANKGRTIAPASLPGSAHTNNYTYSVWFYIDDWNYRYGEPKIVLGRLDKDKMPSPAITLGAIQNNVTITLACYPKEGAKDAKPVIHSCALNNVPLQKWANLLISLNGRTLDVYLDGKLVRTCVLPGVAKINTAAPIYITPEGGFSGWTSNIEYLSQSTNPSEAWNIYRAGYGGNTMSNLVNKYRIKFSLMEDNMEKSSFEI